MPYFFVLPAYVFLLVILVLVAAVAYCVERWRPASRYILGGAVGTLPGVIVANVLVTLIGILPALVIRSLVLPGWLEQTTGVLAGVTLIVGPIVASVVGVIIGFGTGMSFVYGRKRR
ncbi:MAG: hypothetical protein HYZ26_02220 [Chloroflexi bacterium]|nr:hypothetical protein [Chloroflexota bacterium]